MLDEPMTVFLVTSGCYSDYGVEAVFSSLELARAYIGSRTGDVRIEPYVLDRPDEEPAIRRPWNVQMYLDGNRDDRVVPPYTDEIAPDEKQETDARILSWPGESKKPVLSVRCWADDEQHAVKITNEIRTAFNAGTVMISHWRYNSTARERWEKVPDAR